MKALVDTSVWIEHFRGASTSLPELLADDDVFIHPIVIGELSCGQIRNRREVLDDLIMLPRAKEAGFAECIELIESRQLHGRGLGFSDIQLLASAAISSCSLISFDKAIIAAAIDLGL